MTAAQTYRRHSCVLFPLYDAEDYEEFLYWEIYPCFGDCGGGDLDMDGNRTVICECLYESEPMAIANTLAEATAKARDIMSQFTLLRNPSVQAILNSIVR